MEDKILLVLSVLDGRHFYPQRDPSIKVFVEAKLGNECLSTESVPLAANPSFDYELAFELTKKSFQLNRLNRTPLKVNCIMINTITNKRDVIGNIVMDLRSASHNTMEFKWHKLLNSKFSKHRPELSMRLYVDFNKSTTENESVQVLFSKKPPLVSQPHSGPRADDLVQTKDRDNSETKIIFDSEEKIKPILNIQEGYYQIGPVSSLNEQFVFSVTLAFAENLDSLEVSRPYEEYLFFYSTFGNDVFTEKFQNLANANFPVERASARLKSNQEYLSRYFKQEEFFQITLLGGNTTLAFTNLTLETFASPHFFDNPKPIEGIYKLIPQSNSRIKGSKQPAIGISISLQKEYKESLHISKDEALSVININSSTSTESTSKKALKTTAKSKLSDDEYSAEFEKSSEIENGKNSISIDDSSHLKASLSPEKHISSTEKDFKTHRFTFTVDLRSFRLEDGVTPIKCFFRYNYPFFGTSTPIVTHPAVIVTSTEDTIIPHGYCAFNFITTPAKLSSTLREIPLILEVIEATNANGLELECLVGIGKVLLDSLYKAPKANYTSDTGRLGSRRTSAKKLTMISLNGDELGTLYIVMTLDNLGPAIIEEEKHPEMIDDEQVDDKILDPPEITSDFGVQDTTKPKVLTARDVYKTALELELWKEKQEVLYRQKLKEREAEHLQALSAEWKKRDSDREVYLRKSVKENQQLEDKLKRALADVELRERQISAKDSELERNIKEFFGKVSKTENEAKDNIRRIKTECDYRIEFEKEKFKNLEHDYKKLQEKFAVQEKKLSEKENIIQVVQNKLNSLPEYELQANITVMQAEKNELKKRLETAITSKTRYKEQWGKALRQISLLQQQLSNAEKNELHKKMKELEKDRLKATAQREEKRVASDKQKLDEIKDTVLQMKQNLSSVSEAKVEANVGTQNYIPNYQLRNGANFVTEVLDSTNSSAISLKDPVTYLDGLISEKEILLASGLHTKDDNVIKTLDKYIKVCQNKTAKPN